MADERHNNNEFTKSNEESNGQKRSTKPLSIRQILKEKRELAEKRRFGLAPLAVDVIAHTEISPNVPDNLAQAPWFYEIQGPTLEHQRHKKETNDEVIHENGDEILEFKRSSKYIPGACKNCGSCTHKTSECIYTRKKVGAVYTNKIEGRNVQIRQESNKRYSRKRDRYYGDIGVDLMKQVNESEKEKVIPVNHIISKNTANIEDKVISSSFEGDDGQISNKVFSKNEQGESQIKISKVASEIFQEKSAQHGGLEIKELPKYLQSINGEGNTFFDPKTGAMRGNPNAQDTSRTFQGDLQRYQSGDFHHYVELQYRFLTGQTKSFVDFAYDNEVRLAKEQEGQQSTFNDGENVKKNDKQLLVNKLYTTEETERQETSLFSNLQDGIDGVNNSNNINDKHSENLEGNKNESIFLVTSNINDEKINKETTKSSNLENCQDTVEQLIVLNKTTSVADEMESLTHLATRHQHLHVYGSGFDTKSFR